MKALAALLFFAVASNTLAQSEVSATPESAELRTLLELRLEQVDASARSLQDAIDAIDAGRLPDEVRADLLDRFRDRVDAGRDGWAPFAGPDLPHDAGPGPERDRGPRNGAGRDRRGPSTNAVELSPEQREEILVMLDDLDPNAARKLRKELEKDGVHSRGFARLLPRLADLARLKREDPEMFNLKRDEIRVGRRVAVLTRAYARSDDPDTARDVLAEAVRSQVSVRSQIRTLELERLETRLESLRAEVEAFDLDERTNAAVDRLLERAKNWKPSPDRRGPEQRDRED